MWEKIGLGIAALLLAGLGFLFGIRRSRRNDRPGDTDGAISDIRKAAGTVGESADRVSTSAAEAGGIAEGTSSALDRLEELAEQSAGLGAEATEGREDSDRASQLIAELNRRHGEKT